MTDRAGGADEGDDPATLIPFPESRRVGLARGGVVVRF